MDRAPELPPIVVERHDLPTPMRGDLVRRRGAGYQPIRRTVVAAAAPAGGANRAARRQAARRMRPPRLAPVAALLLTPIVSLTARPAAAAPARTATSTTVAGDGTTTTTASDASTSTTSGATTTQAPPTSTSTTTTTVPTPTSTSTTTTSPPTATTNAPRTTTTTVADPSDPSEPTVPATVVPSTTTSSSTTTTVPGAIVAPPVGTAELPPETPVGADPVAMDASDLLTMHHELVTSTRALARLGDERTVAGDEVARLEARTAELTADAFARARAGEATAEVELARSDAQEDLELARGAHAALALRAAAAQTALDDLAARYPTARLTLATLVAARLDGGVRPAALDAAWASAPDPRLDVLYAALAQVGDPYVWATAGPDQFDCSGLTGFAWKAAGVELPHYTVLQRQATLDVPDPADLQPGDLVFNLDGPNGGHVMLSLGLGRFVVHAPAPGQTVTVGEYRSTTGFGSPMDDARELGDAASAVAPTTVAPTSTVAPAS